MSAQRYQEIQDMRETRTKRSEFRSGAKMTHRPMTQVNVPHNRRHDDLSPVKVTLGFIFLAALFVIGMLWDAGSVQGVLTFLRMQP